MELTWKFVHAAQYINNSIPIARVIDFVDESVEDCGDINIGEVTPSTA